MCFVICFNYFEIYLFSYRLFRLHRYLKSTGCDYRKLENLRGYRNCSWVLQICVGYGRGDLGRSARRWTGDRMRHLCRILHPAGRSSACLLVRSLLESWRIFRREWRKLARRLSFVLDRQDFQGQVRHRTYHSADAGVFEAFPIEGGLFSENSWLPDGGVLRAQEGTGHPASVPWARRTGAWCTHGVFT